VSKETYYSVKRDLHRSVVTDAGRQAKTTVSKETYYSVKRDLHRSVVTDAGRQAKSSVHLLRK
jgi:hypothetical protein